MKANLDLLEVPELVDELRWIANHLDRGPIQILLAAIIGPLDKALAAVTEHCCPTCARQSDLARSVMAQRELQVIGWSYRDGLIDEDDAWRLTAEVIRNDRLGLTSEGAFT